ncbi:MAG TPA: hypothetical protein VEL07_10855 [Planctomycetota bacterium]|nr:hypothetical protein [Planctomycetota bacterium]
MSDHEIVDVDNARCPVCGITIVGSMPRVHLRHARGIVCVAVCCRTCASLAERQPSHYAQEARRAQVS